MSGIIEQFTLMMTQSTGFSQITGGMIIMWAVCVVLFYLAIVKDYEPLLLLPIAFGALLANVPPGVCGLWRLSRAGWPVLLISRYLGCSLRSFLGVGALRFRPLLPSPLLLGRGAVGHFLHVRCGLAGCPAGEW
ncbi:MAG: sodium ion-translocating decarboxylase subunit beta [Propionivibrio sp.]|nr:sodium ion-translocating decarboxylase subunit beta [Propionivibrio sp.]